MLDGFLFSINSVLPIFLMAILGWLLWRLGLFSEQFFKEANRFVFRVSLPITLFLDVLGGGSLLRGGSLILYCVGFLAIEISLLLLAVPLLIKDNPSRGAFIQGAYRSNVAIIGMPLIVSMFGDLGAATIATVMPIMVVLYNALAVTVLSIYAPSEKRQSVKLILLKILRNIITNPLIIGILLGMIVLSLPMELPTVVTKPLEYLDGLTMPLALMSLGASFRFEQLKGRLSLCTFASCLRCVIFPVMAVIGAILIGLRGVDLGVVFVIFGSSTAVASYVMADSMGSDSILAGQIVLMTTLISCVTIFIGTMLLRVLGFF